MAMVAPRALLVFGNPDYEWLADESGYVSCRAAQKVWDALGVPDRFGFSKVGGHGHCSLPTSQYPEVEAFIDKFLLGEEDVDTDYAIHPNYTSNLEYWIPWSTPELSNDTTYFTNLVFPEEEQFGLDTSITFRWNKIESANKYYIQLSSDEAFQDIILTDSTLTDTLITIDTFSKMKKYYWRVQVLNNAGLGPWSSSSNFITTAELPGIPNIVDAYSAKFGYITMEWEPVPATDFYYLQISKDKNISKVFKTSLLTDTVRTLSWFEEGTEYYWHVRAENLAGYGEFSEIQTIIYLDAPANLILENSESNEITLTWDDKSDMEEGYIIERKLDTDSDFYFIDSLSENCSTYVDQNLENDKTYTYRVRAFNSRMLSSYSNEASLITDIETNNLLPTEFELKQNYPNPFNPTTKIEFAVPKAAQTKVVIYDLLGREITTLLDKVVKAGYHNINFNAANLPSGVYLYRIKADNFVDTKKMILLK